MAERLYATGTVGFTNGFRWMDPVPADNDIDPDNDGVMNPGDGGYRALVDLSQVSSELLGMQCTQSSKYTIRRMWISLRNVDDLDDNDDGAYFGGTVRWYHPTQHRLEALSLARAVDKAEEEAVIDADSHFLSTEKDYTAMRFSWGSSSDYGLSQITYPTTESVSGHPGSRWGLGSIFSLYNEMTEPNQTNALFTGRAGDKSCKIPWCASVSNSAATGAPTSITGAPYLTDWNSGAIRGEALAGLVMVNVSVSNTDPPGLAIFEDDYYLVVGIEYDIGVDA